MVAIWRLLDAVMGDPVEGSEPKDRLKYAVLGVLYLLLAITTLGVTIANWTGDDTEAAASGDEGSQQAASTLFDWPAGRWLVGILGVALIGYAGYSFYKQVMRKEFAERLGADENSWVVRLGEFGYAAQALVYAVIGYFFIQVGDRLPVDDGKRHVRRLDRAGRHDLGQGDAVGHRDRTVRLRDLLHRRGEVPQGSVTATRTSGLGGR